MGLPANMGGGPKGPPAGADHAGPPPEIMREMMAKQAALAKMDPRARPVYAYPQVAAYNGTGSMNEASSFHAVTPAPQNGISDWIGARP